MQNLTKFEEASQRGSEYVLNVVIKSLRSIFPGWKAAIKTQVELDNLKQQWLIAFIENNIKTDTQIQRGLAAARLSTSSFLPSIGQFIDWCKSPPPCPKEFIAIEHNRPPVTMSRIAAMRNMTAGELELLHAVKDMGES